MSELEDKLERVLQACRAAGLRKTRALQDVLRVLIRRDAPTTLPQLAAHRSLKDHYDQATLYRMLTRLEEKAILQRLGLHNRAAHYVLRWPGEHDDYLVCTRCGTIERIDMACPVHKLEREVAQRFGYQDLHHELEFFGVCPDCVEA